MTLPPLANLLAVRIQDPRQEALLRGRFPIVLRPAPGWAVGVRPLPGTPPDLQDPALLFAEGERAVGPGGREHAARRADANPSGLHEVVGDFTFLYFGPDGTLRAVRSVGGLVPLYVSDAGDIVGTQLGEVLPHLRASPAIDPLPLAAWVSGWPAFPEGRSFLAGVKVVPRGGFVSIDARGGIRRGGYFDPRPEGLIRPSEGRARAHAERLRSLLLERVETDLDPDGDNLLTLSGGIDSGALAALAGRRGRAYSALSLVPGAPAPREHELSYIREATRDADLRRHVTFTLDAATVDRLYRHSRPGDPVFYVPHPALQFMPDLLKEVPVRVLAGGEFGDEVGGSHFTLPDWVDAVPLWELLMRPGRLAHGPQDVLRWVKWRTQDILRRPRHWIPPRTRPWLAADVRAEYEEWQRGEVRAHAADRRPLRGLAQRVSADGWLAMNWEVASALGVRRSFPFFNRAALELAFDCHPAELVAPGLRRLTRRALDGLVPARVLDRPDKGVWGREEPLAAVPRGDVLPADIPSAAEPLLDPAWAGRVGTQDDVATVPAADAIRLWLLMRLARSLRSDA